MAAVLWCGGEDIDFPNGAATPVSTNSAYFRTGYARCAVGNVAGTNTTSARSLSFVGGGVTSCWLHAYCAPLALMSSSVYIGLGLNSAAQVAIAIGTSTASASKTALWLFSSGSWTQLATETGASLGATQTLDMNVQSFGASATVTVYVNGVSVISYSGSTTVTGVASLDCVCLVGGSNYGYISEIVVTDTLDTRSMSLLTGAPNAVGDTNNWTAGTYANINPTSINDTSVISVNTTVADFQANVTDLPAGTFSVNAVKVSARAEVTAGAVPTGIKLGVRISAVNYLDTAHTLTAAFAPYERLMTTNPATSAAWAQSDINPLQLALESA